MTTLHTRRHPRRDLNKILSRGRTRTQSRRHVFAPDFLHGAHALGHLYGCASVDWVEGVTFVVPVLGPTGQSLGYVLGKMQDHFFEVEECLRSECEAFDAWIASKLRASETIVALGFEQELGEDVQQGFVRNLECDMRYIPVRVTRSQLESMERVLLAVYRDMDDITSTSSREARVAQARVDLLTLLGLCTCWMGGATLGQDLTPT